MLAVLESFFFNGMENFSLNFATHKNQYSLHSELSSSFGVLCGCVSFGDQLRATKIVGRYSNLKIIAHLCNSK